MKNLTAPRSVFSLFALLLTVALCMPMWADDGEGGGTGGGGGGGGMGGPNPEIITADYMVEQGTPIVYGHVAADLSTCIVEIDGDAGSAVGVDANGNFEIDVTGYDDFVDIVATDINGVSELVTVQIY